MKGLSAALRSERPGVLYEALHGTVAQPSLLGGGLLRLDWYHCYCFVMGIVVIMITGVL